MAMIREILKHLRVFSLDLLSQALALLRQRHNSMNKLSQPSIHKVALLPRLGIWEGQTTIILHHHGLESMLFVNMPMLAAIPIPVVLPLTLPMVVPTPVIRTEVTAMATNDA